MVYSYIKAGSEREAAKPLVHANDFDLHFVEDNGNLCNESRLLQLKL